MAKRSRYGGIDPNTVKTISIAKMVEESQTIASQSVADVSEAVHEELIQLRTENAEVLSTMEGNARKRHDEMKGVVHEELIQLRTENAEVLSTMEGNARKRYEASEKRADEHHSEEMAAIREVGDAVASASQAAFNMKLAVLISVLIAAGAALLAYIIIGLVCTNEVSKVVEDALGNALPSAKEMKVCYVSTFNRLGRSVSYGTIAGLVALALMVISGRPHKKEV